MAATRDLYTADGPMALEEYVARVVTAENGTAADPALRALAIAARTFVLRAIRDSRTLGTPQNPIINSPKFQVFAHRPATRPSLATAATLGAVCRYRGELVICNFVAGAIWTADGKPGQDPTHTEKWVTYNEGKTGAAVKPTPLSNTSRPDNRGCMSQNGSDYLARHGYEHEAILRYFYGADLEIGPLEIAPPAPGPIPPIPSGPTLPPATPRPTAPSAAAAPAPSSSSPLPVIALAAFALLKKGGL